MHPIHVTPELVLYAAYQQAMSLHVVRTIDLSSTSDDGQPDAEADEPAIVDLGGEA